MNALEPTTVARAADVLAQLLEVVGHPIRLRVLAELYDRQPLSPKDLSRYLELELGVVAYHVRKMRREQLLEVASTRRVRGAEQTFYFLTDAGRGALLAALDLVR